MKCFECGARAEYQHHVVPRSLGGTKKVPLCEMCHGKIHGVKMVRSSTLIKKVMLDLRSKNKRISGKVPYGYDLIGSDLVENVYEQSGIKTMMELRRDGLSLRKIASELSSKGIRTKSGAEWSATVIMGILKRSMG